VAASWSFLSAALLFCPSLFFWSFETALIFDRLVNFCGLCGISGFLFAIFVAAIDSRFFLMALLVGSMSTVPSSLMTGRSRTYKNQIQFIDL